MRTKCALSKALQRPARLWRRPFTQMRLHRLSHVSQCRLNHPQSPLVPVHPSSRNPRRRSSEGLVSLPPNPFCVDLTDEEPVDTDVTSKNSSSMNCGIQSGAGGSLARWGAWTPLSHRYSDATVPFRCLDVLNKDRKRQAIG